MAARHRETRARKPLIAVAAVATFVTCLGMSAVPVAAADVAVTGSGSTFAGIAIDQWRADAAQQLGIQVSYNLTGSSTGRTQFRAGAVDWAASDLPYMAGLEELPPQPFAYMPLVAGGIALPYNLRDAEGRRIDGVRLTGPLVAQIFTGQIDSWRDPAILAAQASDVAARLPDLPVQRVVRFEAAGTTAVFMQYMAAVAPEDMQALRDRFSGEYRTPQGVLWTDVFPGQFGFDPEWTNFTYATGSYQLASIVANANSNGTIGYAEAGYALAAGLPMVFLENAAGNFTLPTPRNVAVALLAAAQNPDGTQDLTAVFTSGRPEAYPISSYTYAIVPTTGINPDKGSTLGKFLTHALTRGQDKMAPLGYSPLPPNLVEQGFGVIRQIAGAPDPGPLGDWGQQYLSLVTGEVQYAARNRGIISLTSSGATQLDSAFATAAHVPLVPSAGLPADPDRFQCVALVRPAGAIGADQARQLRRYVIQGGTLLYVTGEPDASTFNRLAEDLGIATRRGTGTVTLATAPVVGTNRAAIGLASHPQPMEFAPILAAGTADPVLTDPASGAHVLVAEDLGAGRVVTSGSDAIFGPGSGEAALPRNLCGGDQALVCDDPGEVIQAVEGVPTVGSPGDDVILGTSGADTIDGGGGDDVICSLAGDDHVSGGDGEDLIDGGVGDDSITGGLAKDLLLGGSGLDHLDGGAKRDHVVGGPGSDELIGAQAADRLEGSDGADSLWGNEGNDTLAGGGGGDRLDGGIGFDTVVVFHAPLAAPGTTVTLDGVADDGQSGEADNAMPTNERVVGTIGPDRLIAAAGPQVLVGLDDADSLYGNGGADTLTGGVGADTLVGGIGDDELFGGPDLDSLDGGDGNDTCRAGGPGEAVLACEL